MDATHLRLQALLYEGSDPTEDLRAAARGQWADLQRQRVPQPSMLHPFARRQWSEAITAGQAWKPERHELGAHLVAVWCGDNDIEAPIVDWRPTAAVLGGTHSRLLTDSVFEGPLDAHYAVRLLIQPVLHLVPAGRAAPTMSFGAFDLIEVPVLQLVAINERFPIEAVAPDDPIAPYSMRIEPCHPLPLGLDEALQALARDFD